MVADIGVIGEGLRAGARRIAVPGPLQPYLPAGGIQRGTVLTVGGGVGHGATTVAFELAAAVTCSGEWAAFVDPGSLGGRAALEVGVALERCAVIRGVAPERWAITVAALLDGVSMVCAAVPGRLALGDARRLQARVRERQSVLVVLEAVPGMRVGQWPGEAAQRIVAMFDRDGQRCYDVRGKGVPHQHLRLAAAG